MGLGAIMTSGLNNAFLPDSLVGCITEARVEQAMDIPTKFAVRFEEDLSGGEPVIMNEAQLQCEQMFSIAVDTEDSIQCLVRGPITDVECSVQLGGPGSWYQIHGQDRRIELDRTYQPRAWSGRASAAAQEILDKLFVSDIETTSIVYGGAREDGRETLHTLNQRTTDAEFIRNIARDNNFHFWLSYSCDAQGESLNIVEHANLKSSPPRNANSSTGDAVSQAIKLTPSNDIVIRVNVDKEQCQNVTSFEITMNPEQPNRFEGAAVDDRQVRSRKIPASDPQPAINEGGQRLSDCSAQRDAWVTTAGDQEELNNKAESALTEAAWYVEATANTTAHMLGGVLQPHDVVEVHGLGVMHSGLYQVKAVTHVINPAEHFMEIKLRRNAVGSA